MSKVINVINVDAARDDMFTERVNEALADGWELEAVNFVACATPRMIAVLLREETMEQTPGQRVSGKGRGKSKDAPIAEPSAEVPEIGAE